MCSPAGAAPCRRKREPASGAVDANGRSRRARRESRVRDRCAQRTAACSSRRRSHWRRARSTPETVWQSHFLAAPQLTSSLGAVPAMSSADRVYPGDPSARADEARPGPRPGRARSENARGTPAPWPSTRRGVAARPGDTSRHGIRNRCSARPSAANCRPFVAKSAPTPLARSRLRSPRARSPSPSIWRSDAWAQTRSLDVRSRS